MADEQENFVDISGMPKKYPLAALFNRAPLQGWALAQPEDISLDDAGSIIEEHRKEGFPLGFDYIRGRSLKVDLSGDAFDPQLYNRGSVGGINRAQEAINEARKQWEGDGSPQPSQREKRYLRRLAREDARRAKRNAREPYGGATPPAPPSQGGSTGRRRTGGIG